MVIKALHKGSTKWSSSRRKLAAALSMEALRKKLGQLVEEAAPLPVLGGDDEESDVQVDNVTSHVHGAELKTPDSKGISKPKFNSGMSTARRGTTRNPFGDSGGGESQCGDLCGTSVWEHNIVKYDLVAILSGQKMGKERR
eukprot:437494-Pyramimonas_sp.AAC.1